MSTTQGFTPSQQNLIGLNPYGFDYRKVGSLQPDTNYFFCVRVLDEYSACSDTCFGPCKTMPAPDMSMTPIADMSMMPTPDMAMTPISDMAMMPISDMAMMPTPDMAPMPIDMTPNPDLSIMQSPDLTMSGMRADLSTVSDANTGMNGDLGMVVRDANTGMNADDGIPVDADVDALIADQHGKDVGGCGCSLTRKAAPRGTLAMTLLLGLFGWRRRRRS